MHFLWRSVFLFMISVVLAKISYNTIKVTTPRYVAHTYKVIDKTCLLKPQQGPCRSRIKMYYFDPEEMTCNYTFHWGGCQGNGNRFFTKQECNLTCISQPGVPKRIPRFCQLTFDYGFCFGALERYYYDPKWHVCKKRIYSGCGGNKNNFYQKEQCDAVCRYGTGALTRSNKRVTGYKKLIVNPEDTTKSRGLDQGDGGSGKGKTTTEEVERHIMVFGHN